MNKTLIFVSVIAAILASGGGRPADGRLHNGSGTGLASGRPGDSASGRRVRQGVQRRRRKGRGRAVCRQRRDRQPGQRKRPGAKGHRARLRRVSSRPIPSRRSPYRSSPSAFSNPTTAVEDGTSTVTAPSGQVIEQNRYMVVYAKQDGAWRMATARDLPGEQASSAAELKDLQWLIGNWVDETPGATVTTSYRSADDGRSILGEFHVQIGGKTGHDRHAADRLGSTRGQAPLVGA